MHAHLKLLLRTRVGALRFISRELTRHRIAENRLPPGKKCFCFITFRHHYCIGARHGYSLKSESRVNLRLINITTNVTARSRLEVGVSRAGIAITATTGQSYPHNTGQCGAHSALHDCSPLHAGSQYVSKRGVP